MNFEREKRMKERLLLEIILEVVVERKDSYKGEET